LAENELFGHLQGAFTGAHSAQPGFFPEGEQVMDKNLRFPDKFRIAHEILAYLMDHPDAQDTLDGVVQWWLLERKIKNQTDLTKEALAELVSKGLVLESESGDSRIHYRMNPDKSKEIQRLLRG
jgi:hypothetical protein